MQRSFEESIKDQIKSKVWDALESISTEYPDIPDELHKEAMEEAIEWFMVHFYK